MTIEKLSETTVKISLSEKELISYKVEFDMLDGENPAVRKMLNEILDDVRKKTGMKLNNEKLFIEAFMCPDTSCVIYISVIENLKVRKKSSVYGFLTLEFNDAAVLTKISRGIFLGFSHIIKDSFLYFQNGTYRLILKVYGKSEKRLEQLLDSYCTVYSGELVKNITEEYSECICDRNAVERLSETGGV